MQSGRTTFALPHQDTLWAQVHGGQLEELSQIGGLTGPFWAAVTTLHRISPVVSSMRIGLLDSLS